MQTRFSYFLVSQHHNFPCMPNIKAEYHVIRVFAKKITSKSHTELQNAYFFIPCEIRIYPYDQHVLWEISFLFFSLRTDSMWCGLLYLLHPYKPWEETDNALLSLGLSLSPTSTVAFMLLSPFLLHGHRCLWLFQGCCRESRCPEWRQIIGKWEGMIMGKWDIIMREMVVCVMYVDHLPK